MDDKQRSRERRGVSTRILLRFVLLDEYLFVRSVFRSVSGGGGGGDDGRL